MYSSLSEVFSKYFSHIDFDQDLVKEIYKYHIHISTMTPEHIQFFGGNLLGVNTLRFLPRDVTKFFDRILDIDFGALEKDIRKVNTIYHENSISGDIFNLSLFYMMHRFLTSKDLDEKMRMRGAYDCALVFCYRTTIALTNNYFRYNADPRVAQAAYANLSNKHLIKRLGTWGKLCDYRAQRIVEKKQENGKPGQNYDRLVLFNDDIEVTSMIQDSQGRFKSIFRLYYDEFDKVHKDGESIASTSATITDADGDEVLRERTKGAENLLIYIRSIINDGVAFIDDDLITVVADINKNTSFKTIKSFLEWMVNAYHEPKWNPRIDKFLTNTLVQSVFYIEYNIPINRRNDLAFILVTLKNLYLSTQSTDPQLLAIRKQGEELLKAYNKGISKSLMTSTRSSILLYIILRALVGDRGR